MKIALPTPIQPLGAGIWVKRDDLSSPVYGGNKVRKLGFLLPDAARKHADTLITVGAWGSHHCLATSLFGAREGFEVHAVLVPQPMTDHVEENLRADLAAGATLHPARNYFHAAITMSRLARELRGAGKRPYLIGHGGSSPMGTFAFADAAREMATQIEEHALPEFDAIYIALGSGATAVGLALGLATTRLKTRVIAVRTISPWVCNRPLLAQLAYRTASLMREQGLAVSVRDAMRRLVIDGSQYGSGYGYETSESAAANEAAARHGLGLDPTYTAKTFAACLRGSEAARLYWHTLSSADLSPLLANAPAVPSWATPR